MELDFDRVTMIVDQEYDDRQFPPDHLCDFLSRELKRAVSDHCNDAAIRRPQCITEGCWHRPTDMTILHFNFEAGIPRHFKLHAVEPGISGLRDNCGIGGNERTDLADDFGTHELCVRFG